MKEGKITLSQKQLKTFKVINRFIDKSITRQQAAELLSISPHQITRLKKGISHAGQLIQIDATPYEWFSGSVKYALHGAIDDATGNIVGLYMTQNECLFGYLEMMHQCCLDFGALNPPTLIDIPSSVHQKQES